MQMIGHQEHNLFFTIPNYALLCLLYWPWKSIQGGFSHRSMEHLRNSTEPQKRASSVQAQAGTGFSKTDLRYWRDRVFRPIYTRGGDRHESPNLAIYIQHRGRRHKWSLGTPNRDAAAAKARDIFLILQAQGWDAAVARYRPRLAEKKRDVTVGEFIEEVKAKADLEARTIEGYSKAFRTIVAAAFEIDGGKEKFDHRKGGHQKWLARVHGVKLSTLTPVKIQEWKRAYLAKAKRDPLSQRQAKVSVNSFMRQARSLFSPDILRHLSIELPEPLPFTGIAFEPRQSLKYRSSFDVLDLIKKARSDLAESDTELFKIFLLAVMVGLRRREIDLLEWPSFRWDAGVVRIEPTRHFHPKSEDSIGDVAIDPELMEMFRGYRARTTGDFVIESMRKPKPDVIYDYCRCQDQFKRLAKWLRKHGVKASKPLHTLRKEYGSQINAVHGIHAASRALRHADIRMTNEYYTDSRARVTPGMGHLLKDDDSRDGDEPDDKISDFTTPAKEPVKRKKTS
jgi:integrase